MLNYMRLYHIYPIYNTIHYMLVQNKNKYSKLIYIMVQIYNPNVVGKQILIDVKNIESDRLKTVENFKADYG